MIEEPFGKRDMFIASIGLILLSFSGFIFANLTKGEILFEGTNETTSENQRGSKATDSDLFDNADFWKVIGFGFGLIGLYLLFFYYLEVNKSYKIENEIFLMESAIKKERLRGELKKIQSDDLKQELKESGIEISQKNKEIKKLKE